MAVPLPKTTNAKQYRRMPVAGRAAQARVFLGTPAGPEELSGNKTRTWRPRRPPSRIPVLVLPEYEELTAVRLGMSP